MGKLFLALGIGVFIGSLGVAPASAAGLVLSGVVARTMGAELRMDPYSRFLTIKNTGNESFKIEVTNLVREKLNASDDAQVPAQLGLFLANVLPARMQSDIDLRKLEGKKNTYNVSILAP